MITETQGTVKVRCSELVTRYFESHQCDRFSVATEDGKPWCRQHLPSTIKAKQEAREKSWKAEWAKQTENKRRQDEETRRAQAYPGLLAACKKAYVLLDGSGRDGSYTNLPDALELLETAIKRTGKAGEAWLQSR